MTLTNNPFTHKLKDMKKLYVYLLILDVIQGADLYI